MKILIVTATPFELEPFQSHFKIAGDTMEINQHSVNLLATGVGMTATAFALGKKLAHNQYDVAINAGIAGAFDRSLRIGEVVTVGWDSFSELGAEDGEDFITIDELNLGKSSIKANHSPGFTGLSTLKNVRGITVNKVHGNDESIYTTVNRLNPQTESMEGAAFFFACNHSHLPCLQIRAISNYVERRNRDSWDIPLAVHNLNATLIELINKLS
jgi:futalosine hydrolase